MILLTSSGIEKVYVNLVLIEIDNILCEKKYGYGKQL